PVRSGESVLGDIVADAQLAATSSKDTGEAVLAITNPGGIRNSIMQSGDGTVTYADVFASQPFRNQLVTITLTGAQIRRMLEQQWTAPSFPRILQVSKGFSYTWDNARPVGNKIVTDSVVLNGEPVDSDTTYRVTVNNYLHSGGDGFSVLTEGKDPRVGAYDVDALTSYLKANSPVSPIAPSRILRLN
ncbi:MAG: bifunctional metallophosphatase/5'-nucleotidase, partial [Oxalobacteraceae bacterium]